MDSKMSLRRCSRLVLILFAVFAPSTAWGESKQTLNLTEFSLEELLAIEVVSVSGKSERAHAAAAAVYVITAEDIRRSGATNIPELLRVVPGITVGRIDANKWAVSSRGFNGRFASMLQVLVDGRSIYSPMFSGVYWEAGEVPLNSIERIEVIRGPGATIWGTNAVNGVINIITRNTESKDLPRKAALSIGQEERYRFVASTGRLDLGGAGLNVNLDLHRQDASAHDDRGAAFDAWDSGLLSGRLDWFDGKRDRIFLSGHYYRGEIESEYPLVTHLPPYQGSLRTVLDFETASLSTSGSREFSPDHRVELGLSYSHLDRDDEYFQEQMGVLDIDLQHQFALADRHSLIWGAAWRHYDNKTQGYRGTFVMTPANYEASIFSGFLQDEIELVQERLRLVLGSKYEAHDNLVAQWQPSCRLAWTPDRENTLWAAVSRALRTPARVDRHMNIDIAAMPPGSTPWNPDFPVMVSLLGTEGLESEELIAWEMGYRSELTNQLHLDVAAYLNRYDNLRGGLPGEIRPHPILGMPVMQMPIFIVNEGQGDTWGGELSLAWQVHASTRLTGSWSRFEFDPEMVAVESGELQYMSTPRDQFSLRGQITPADGWEVDFWFRNMGDLEGSSLDIPSWSELDLRLGWRPSPRWRLTLAGQNLLNEDHLEFEGHGSSPNLSYIERGFYAEVEWAF
jgi:iron complex outermembrane recepter protein